MRSPPGVQCEYLRRVLPAEISGEEMERGRFISEEPGDGWVPGHLILGLENSDLGS